MKRLFALLLCLLLSACTRTVSPPEPVSPLPEALGLMELTITLGDEAAGLAPTSSVRWLESALDGQALDNSLLGAGIQLEFVTVSTFTLGSRPARGQLQGGGERYVNATYRVRNAQSDGTPYARPRQNLTFLATDTNSTAAVRETIGETAVGRLTTFGNSDADPAIAPLIVPTHALDYNLATRRLVMRAGGEDFQAFRESELPQSLPAGVDGFFPFGFVTRCVANCVPGTRSLAANPAAGQFDGLVTLSFRLPLQSTASRDPFAISFIFTVFDDTNTRVTGTTDLSLSDALDSRADAVSPAAEVALLGLASAAVTDNPIQRICRLRFAGTGANARYLVDEHTGVCDGTPPSSGTFMTPMNYAVAGAVPSRMVAADFNGNGSIDIMVMTNDRLTLLRNYGNGTFEALEVFHQPQGSGYLAEFASGDFNGDGKADLVVGRYFFGEPTQRMSLLLGVGDGTFSAPTDYYPQTPYGLGFHVGDFNRDGHLDVLAIGDRIFMFPGRGDGTFGTPVQSGVFSTESIVLRDFNRDGSLDLASTSAWNTRISVHNGRADGTFGAVVPYFTGGTGSGPLAITSGDFNGNGYLDLVATDSQNLMLFVNDGSSFTQTTRLPQAHKVAGNHDLNHDGKLDLVLLRQTPNGAVSIIPGLGGGNFGEATSYPVGVEPEAVVIADFNGDGKADIAVGHWSSSFISVLLQRP